MTWPAPETAKEALEWWDGGKPLMSLEMSGVGPSHEQSCQILVFEIVRDWLRLYPEEIPTEGRFEEVAERALSERLERAIGPTGVMWGIAKNVAFHVLQDGWAKTVNEAGKDRYIMVGKNFPHLEVVG